MRLLVLATAFDFGGWGGGFGLLARHGPRLPIVRTSASVTRVVEFVPVAFLRPVPPDGERAKEVSAKFETTGSFASL